MAQRRQAKGKPCQTRSRPAMNQPSPFGRRLACHATRRCDRRALRRAGLFKLGSRLSRFRRRPTKAGLGDRASFEARDDAVACPGRERKSVVMVRPHQGRHIPAIAFAFEPSSGASTGKFAFLVPSASEPDRVAGPTAPAGFAPMRQITSRDFRSKLGALASRRNASRSNHILLMTARSTLPRDRLIRRRTESPHAVVLDAPPLEQSMTCPAKCLSTPPIRKRPGWWS